MVIDAGSVSVEDAWVVDVVASEHAPSVATNTTPAKPTVAERMRTGRAEPSAFVGFGILMTLTAEAACCAPSVGPYCPGTSAAFDGSPFVQQYALPSIP